MKTIICQNEDEWNNELFELFSSEVLNGLKKKEYINIGIATGNTYISFMHRLSQSKSIPFNKINLYLIDEYAGVDYCDEKSCAIDIVTNISCLKSFKSFNHFGIEYEKEIKKYNVELERNPLDIVLLGLGKDGHFAFCYSLKKEQIKTTYQIINFSVNDRIQQVKYGWFKSASDVPLKGITLTLWGALNSKKIIIGAKYSEKSEIIDKITQGKIDEKIPVYPLLTKDNCILIYG